jgi:hypothetical protein|tara:strand:+ start:956 stop:1360 length:405 start_codon:yes stop_codon:yes gene_type:complete
MSKFMLDDKATMDHVNPFVQNNFSLPGTVRNPGDFAKHKPIEKVTMANDFKSPMCDYGVTVGWGAPNMCADVQGERCHLSRPLLPGRNIDRGYDEETETSTNGKKLVLRDSSGELTLTAYVFIALIILLLFLTM